MRSAKNEKRRMLDGENRSAAVARTHPAVALAALAHPAVALAALAHPAVVRSVIQTVSVSKSFQNINRDMSGINTAI